MLNMALIASFLAVFSPASPVEYQTSGCPWNGVANADNFTLLAVFKTDNAIRKSLALGSNGQPDPSSLAWLGVFMLPFFRSDGANMLFVMVQSTESINSIVAKYFVLTDGQIAAYGPGGSIVGVSNQVANSNGQLSFLRPGNGRTSHSTNVYCELVSLFDSLSSRDWPY